MAAIALGLALLVGMGLWFLANSWMDSDLLKPMKAVLIVFGVIGGLLVLWGLVDVVLG